MSSLSSQKNTLNNQGPFFHCSLGESIYPSSHPDLLYDADPHVRLVATKLLEMVAGSVDEQMAKGHLEATRKGYKVCFCEV